MLVFFLYAPTDYIVLECIFYFFFFMSVNHILHRIISSRANGAFSFSSSRCSSLAGIVVVFVILAKGELNFHEFSSSYSSRLGTGEIDMSLGRQK